MKRFVSVALLSMFVVCSAVAAGSHRVRLRILDRDQAQPGVKVLVVVPDGVHTCGTTIALTSDAEGFAQFTTEQNVFWVSVPSLNPQAVGQRFDLPKAAAVDVRWDLRPRDWKREVKR